MSKIFISLRYQDKQYVTQLSERLINDNIQVLTDEKDLAFGDNIAENTCVVIEKTGEPLIFPT